MHVHNPQRPPSEGEEFLADFFDSIGIPYMPEKKINGLKCDSKMYRTADFYLPKFKVYVEFFGLWNNACNEEYRQKKDVYRANKIPCVYLYPENLGIIGFTFDKRIQAVMKMYDMKKEIRKYKLFKLKESRELRNRIGILAICVFLGLTILSIGLHNANISLVILVSLIALYQCKKLYNLYMDIFKRNKYSLEHI